METIIQNLTNWYPNRDLKNSWVLIIKNNKTWGIFGFYRNYETAKTRSEFALEHAGIFGFDGFGYSWSIKLFKERKDLIEGIC